MADGFLRRVGIIRNSREADAWLILTLPLNAQSSTPFMVHWPEISGPAEISELSGAWRHTVLSLSRFRGSLENRRSASRQFARGKLETLSFGGIIFRENGSLIRAEWNVVKHETKKERIGWES